MEEQGPVTPQVKVNENPKDTEDIASIKS